MEQIVSNLLTTLFGYYLPIGDVSVRIAVSLALAQILSAVFKPLNVLIQRLYDRYVKSSTSELRIFPSNPSHEKVMKYLVQKYGNLIDKYDLESDRGLNTLVPVRFNRNNIDDRFDDGIQSYLIQISLGEEGNNNDKSDQKNNKKRVNRIIQLESKGGVKVLESYVQRVCSEIGNIQCNQIPIYRTHLASKKDDRSIKWKSTVAKLSKNMSNTIVSPNVKSLFYDDIATFMKSEEFYLKKGLPYKRGYLLYGEPGCGKTSLIKAIANEYSMPIFIIDLSTIANNAEFIKITSEINGFITQDQPYVVVYEDLDRSNMFKKWGRCEITIDCFLNILDGLDEYHGRITIISANDVSRITETKALVRPGRIDVVVELPKCGSEQIKDILKFYFERDPEVEIEDNIQISPAQLTQIILSVKDINRIVRLLNKHKNLSNTNVTEVSALYADDKFDDLIKTLGKVDEDDSSEEDETEITRRERIINDLNHDIAEVDIKLLTFGERQLSASETIKRDRLSIRRRSLEETVRKCREKFSIAKYKEDNGIALRGKRGKKISRIRR